MTTKLEENYQYTRETKDRWTLLTEENGWKGDCEDWAYSLAWQEAGYSWLRFWWLICTFQLVFWRTVIGPRKEAHVALWRAGKGWSDSSSRGWKEVTALEKCWPYSPLFLAFTLLKK